MPNAKTETERKAPERAPYPSDLTDAEWAVLEPLLPPPRRRGHPRTVDLREVLNAMLYMARTGCQWRSLPHDLPPWSTVHTYFRNWRLTGEWERINDTLRAQVRRRGGRWEDPTGAVIDAQSAKTTEKGGPGATMRASV